LGVLAQRGTDFETLYTNQKFETMSKNNKNSVKQSIQELALGNYNSYPQEYEVATETAADHIQSLAKGYWDCRDDKEIVRDEKLGINLDDYIAWTFEAHAAYLENAN
jgi:hypothetical protein